MSIIAQNSGIMCFPTPSGITFVEGAGYGIDGDSATQNFSTTLQEDDIVYVVQGCDNDTGLGMVTSGYTDRLNVDTAQPSIVVSWKRMGATPDTSFQVTSKGNLAWVYAVFRGVDTTTAFDASIQENRNDGNSRPNPPSLTTVTDNAFRLIAGFLDDHAEIMTVPTGGWTLVDSVSDEGDFSDVSVILAYKDAGTAGAEDPSNFGSVDTDQCTATHDALRPAV